MDKLNENIEKVIKAHFEEPDKTLKEIFEEFTEGLSEEEKAVFYKNIRKIVN
ncbi:MarR family transcriptional regulator [Clostridium phage HM T]|uniref:MarR family transcriptional regulator n=1 Tax=Clostridium saccharoperbutylacetonicum N1-4(HMT) TaxID=931276 RepID=M1MIX3_9CLOT|nr:hypothetical protein [Clostridium saccharoperbutylacetonicum]AMB17429.1 MarR family transcriptional regulator [Clostridium phage HM T]AGF54781.1 hypothetical protein Cspa_c10050 [Clostridium saccharoperbutylacetonicum N1-4(HMT)]NRT58698.1 5'-deoxynucleotidase YfbR-like HD superfamily hydrolase [Clostridium saccharoperbutylacetonicum]NSB27887.1 5'-deoxynucleotidase YfbR-like HD superfamily hydrolase [Clostridium saccharoperbutylacetonicum]NSB41370.1 5'-deoxynucleotidase YfbR-like HD superfam